MNLDDIEKRLNKTSDGPWVATKGGSQVKTFIKGYSYGEEIYPDKIIYSPAEDNCVLDSDKKEIIGCSEWMRVEWDDLEFIAHARQDVEDLLLEVHRLRAGSK